MSKKKKTTQVFAFMEGVHILSFTITLEETIFHDRFAVNFIATANRKYRNFWRKENTCVFFFTIGNLKSVGIYER